MPSNDTRPVTVADVDARIREALQAMEDRVRILDIGWRTSGESLLIVLRAGIAALAQLDAQEPAACEGFVCEFRSCLFGTSPIYGSDHARWPFHKCLTCNRPFSAHAKPAGSEASYEGGKAAADRTQVPLRDALQKRFGPTGGDDNGAHRIPPTSVANAAPAAPQAAGAVAERIWFCKIGGKIAELPKGADFPMRQAVQTAFLAVTGVDCEFTFSGWGGTLTEPQRAVVENRLPSAEYEAEWHRQNAAAPPAPAQAALPAEPVMPRSWGTAPFYASHCEISEVRKLHASALALHAAALAWKAEAERLAKSVEHYEQWVADHFDCVTDVTVDKCKPTIAAEAARDEAQRQLAEARAEVERLKAAANDPFDKHFELRREIERIERRAHAAELRLAQIEAQETVAKLERYGDPDDHAWIRTYRHIPLETRLYASPVPAQPPVDVERVVAAIRAKRMLSTKYEPERNAYNKALDDCIAAVRAGWPKLGPHDSSIRFATEVIDAITREKAAARASALEEAATACDRRAERERSLAESAREINAKDEGKLHDARALCYEADAYSIPALLPQPAAETAGVEAKKNG